MATYTKTKLRKGILVLKIFLLEFLQLQMVQTLTVDNQLVSARNDCFERIALEAMLPFEKTFRTEDTNSLKMCKEKCLQAGDKCQAISFGVHRRGNGTCQLSSEKYDTTSGRPSGVIFDPDFDLYARKTNCFDLSDNSIAMPVESDPINFEGANVNANDEFDSYGIAVPPPSVQLPNRPVDMAGTPLLVVNPSPPTTGTTLDERPLEGPTVSTAQGGDHLYFSHEIYPLYKYPMLYEHNYPAPNEDVYIPGGYAANVPEVEDRYRPAYSTDDDNMRPAVHSPQKPVFGLGYGNGYSYGTPERYTTTTMQPINIHDNRDRPSYAPRPGAGEVIGGNYPNEQADRDRRPTTSAYDNTAQSPYGPRPSNYNTNRDSRPDYANRPDPPAMSPQDGFITGTSMRPPNFTGSYYNGYVRRNDTGSKPNSYDDDKAIVTYFNPEDYMNGGHKNRPMDFDRDRDHFMDQMHACFRRVLAGKHISLRWVRRSISCERVEECMRECENEKRFMCEGFNYRLDPSGQGQGDCELIEIPLSQMDLYSSPNHRDSNLLRHPDYDYYERDRNAPSSCRRNICQDCSKTPILSSPIYFKPSSGNSGWSDKPYSDEHFLSSNSGYGGSSSDHYRPSSSSTAVDHYHGPSGPPPLSPALPARPQLPPSSSSYKYRPFSPHSSEYQGSSGGSYEFSSHDASYFEHAQPSSYADHSRPDYIDRHDFVRPGLHYYRPKRPDHWQSLPSSSGYDSGPYRPRPDTNRLDKYRPSYRPDANYLSYRPFEPSRPGDSSYHSGPIHDYLNRDTPNSYKKQTNFVPYLIGGDDNWGSYGGSYGGNHNKQANYWGLSEAQRRKDQNAFNYFDLGSTRRQPPYESNTVLNYPGSNYGKYGLDRDRNDYRHQWTRRPGSDECSAKSGEGFRLHKTAVKYSFSVPTLTECERLCYDQNGFVCQTYSYKYSPGRDNCMLCDRPINHLDYFVDIEPDRNYDIYSMSDDTDVCRQPSRSKGSSTALLDPRNAQCFFRAIDATRFYKSIVRDSLTVRSVGECEMECIKSTKFTCRAFAFRYGKQRHSGVIDNCQLSDWPVRDMDKERHLILDATFDIFERASYGHGCEIQPIVDEKHKKLCYLGYGSPAKLLSTAIKKVVSVPSEIACKKECIRFRETTAFKCYSFSYGSRSSSYNCELSDLDQTELKLDIHYTHTKDRDFWLFAWNPFDWTCRDKVTTISGSRVNNDRRMDIFREPGDVAWRHYTVTGKPCRRSSPCEKNLITGFYSCEIDGGEVGSWDYCCKADHPCGYSRGFDYPWCFVGDEADQWRKCSDRYFPGNHTRNHAGNTFTPTIKSTTNTTVKDKKKHVSSSQYQHPPRPGGLQSLNNFAAARLWPVTYLYSEGPPNSTEFSNFVDCNKETC